MFIQIHNIYIYIYIIYWWMFFYVYIYIHINTYIPRWEPRERIAIYFEGGQVREHFDGLGQTNLSCVFVLWYFFNFESGQVRGYSDGIPQTNLSCVYILTCKHALYRNVSPVCVYTQKCIHVICTFMACHSCMCVNVCIHTSMHIGPLTSSLSLNLSVSKKNQRTYT